MAAPRKIETLIQILEDGNSQMYDKQTFNEWTKKNKGRKVHAVFTVIENTVSAAFMRYYWAEPMTKMQIAFEQQGYRWSKEQVHEECKQFSPVMEEEYELLGKIRFRKKSLSDLSMSEAFEYVEDLKRVAAEEFGVMINDPETYNISIDEQ
jgi:hypothetical protein